MVVRRNYCYLLFCAVFFTFLSQNSARSYYRSNICAVINKKPKCCIGWTLDETNLHCTQPVCTGDCEIAGGRCINPDTCLCPGGYVAFSCYVGKFRESTSVCSINCRNGGTCEKDKCICKDGFSGDRCQIAHCPRNCSGLGVCQSDGTCACHDGYSGPTCSEVLKEPCFRDVSRGLCRKEIFGLKTTKEICCNSIGKAWGTPCKKCSTSKSSCDEGYQKVGSKCIDINECKEIPGICVGGICQNDDGSFKCNCQTGTVYDVKKFSCIPEYDVCRRNPRICGQGRCLSNGLGFRCKCFSGYRLSKDGKRCESRPAYLRFDMCHYNRGYLCNNGQCIPQGRSYKCRCDPGYQPSQDRRSCEKELDFCKVYGSRLCVNGVCQAIANNDYRCKCNQGYETSADQKSCISTCERYGDSLCPNGRCVPSSVDGYECQCGKGYYQSLNRKMCVRENNVIIITVRPIPKAMRTVCEYYTLCTNGRCVPVGKTYRCECNSGFERTSDGKACREIPKKTRSHLCDLYADYYCPNARCIPIGSNYRCECNQGYEMGRNGRCQKTGFQGTSSRREMMKRGEVRRRAKDYCSTYTYLCENGRCVATRDYFYCVCNPGYKQVDDKRRCRKVEKKPAKLQTGFYDFCQHYQRECRGGTCHNEPTTYWCNCLPGYRWDDRRLQCVEDRRRQLVSDQWSSYAKIRQKPRDWRRNSRWYFSACERMGRDVCGKGYCVDKSSSFECRCYEGYQSTQHNKRCVDINECDRQPNICWQGRCINTPGAYSCQCMKGFKLSHANKEPMCVDRNECEEGNPCVNGVCRNTWGSFKCVCHDNFAPDKTGKNCVKMSKQDSSKESGQPSGNTTSKVPEVWSDEEMLDTPTSVPNCTSCQYDCRWLKSGKYQCECPDNLVRLGNSELCVEGKAVSEYTFEIQMDEPSDDAKRRKKRSIPDETAASHRLGRIVLKNGVNVDHFANSIVSRYKDSHFYKIIRLGDIISHGNETHTIVDVVFT